MGIDPFTYSPSKSERKRLLEETEAAYHQDKSVLERMALGALAISQLTPEGYLVYDERLFKVNHDIHPYESEEQAEIYLNVMKNLTDELIREKQPDLLRFPISSVRVGGSYFWWQGPSGHLSGDESDPYQITLSEAEVQTGFWKRLTSGQWKFTSFVVSPIDPRQLKVNPFTGYSLESILLR